MNTPMFEIRRDNLRAIVRDKFEGNRAAYSRAAGVHQNQINLLLTNNLAHRRNLGEALARTMEAALNLPAGYFDSSHGADDASTHSIEAGDIDPQLGQLFRRDDAVKAVSFYDRFFGPMVTRITDKSNLIICRATTADMDPDIKLDERVVLDVGVKAISGDGVYVISRGADTFLRRVTRQLSGGWLFGSAGSGDAAGLHIDNLRGIKALARVVLVIRMQAM